MASKIVVIGDVNCELQDVFTKLSKLHIKQNFSFAIIVGDLFGDCSTEHELEQISALLQGNIVVPLPTYFTLGSSPLPTRIIEAIESKDEVCPNLYFLGRRGTLKTSEGVRLVSLGGTLDPDSKSSEKYHPSYTESDARALYGAHQADILITHQWPKDIRVGSKAPFPDTDTPPTEREPFFHLPTEDTDNPDAKPLTRFISLAAYSKTTKTKWMYAFTLDPKAPPALTIPAGTTAPPFAPIPTKRKPLQSQRDSYHRFAVDDDHDNRPRKRRARAPPPGPDQCFFCLSNPNIATHLITSIGDEAYLTTAKGPLPTSKTYPSLKFPSHMLIIPFSHSPTLSSISDPTSRQSTYAEMHRYRSALHSMLRHRANNSLGAVTWEVSRGNGIHIHWQFLPVPADLVRRGLVDAAFKVEAENLKYPRFESQSQPNDGDESAEPGDFFRVWIWEPPQQAAASDTETGAEAQPENKEEDGNKGSEKTLLLPLSPDFRFDLQFGRRVMAKLMGLEKRINWKDDVQSVQEEEADAVAFKEAFKEWDFTLE
ncbi:uncharacterized protein An11g01840 [Aspergillus niger]|uniref:Contig An11c0050, genomic contig n=2 Tax=Aspergillus niger TaxID=5061 RepID=A2QVL4_ASPNC|nr:uncharacterized protein An11g01840 [Aspergillus niger]CAK45918.1 unnamed protein product [Aspergillus niger]